MSDPFVKVRLNCGASCYVPWLHSAPGLEVRCPRQHGITGQRGFATQHTSTIAGPVQQVRRSA